MGNTTSTAMSASDSLRILCCGDSLTEGYTFQESGEFHPYSTRLRALLEEHCKPDLVVVDTAGVSGEMVVPTMTERLDKILKQSSKPYNWVCILGGTNDLGVGQSAEKLLPHLLGLHNRAKQTAGCRTVALAIPQFVHELKPGNEAFRDKKAKVNEALKKYAEDSGSTTIFVDLWNELPFGVLPLDEIAKYWVDGLHMTPRGYDKMAEVIFDSLKQHLTK